MGVFTAVDVSCTRFRNDSPLMLANRSPREWHEVPPALFRVLQAAKAAHDMTDGTFDPRVLRSLLTLGYDRTLPFDQGEVSLDPVAPAAGEPPSERWCPKFRTTAGTSGARRVRRPGRALQVLLGPDPVDLGGIGKGLAVRWASQELAKELSSFMVEAGGDIYCAGYLDGKSNWSIGVEGPTGPSELVCALSVHDRAITTSSVRLRRWRVGNKPAHHLIDPMTGSPGGKGLVSVTVVGKDPARAEVWSKALFISGRDAIAPEAERRSIAALWVDEEGGLSISTAMRRYVTWRSR